MAAIQSLNYTILLCKDVAAARAFYADILGFKVLEDFENWVRFAVGSNSLALRPRGPWFNWHDGELASDSAAVHLAFCVPLRDMEACHDRLAEKGVEILQEPISHDWGHRTLFFKDNEGNILEIYAEL